jgi:hypothetical protein
MTTNGLDMIEAFTRAAEAKIAALTEDARVYEGKREEARAEAGKLRAALAALTGTTVPMAKPSQPKAKPRRHAYPRGRKSAQAGSLITVLMRAAQSDTITKADVPEVGPTIVANAALRGYLDVVRRDRPKTSRYIVSVYRITDKGRAKLADSAGSQGVA